MLTVRIDGQSVVVEAETTILEAARRLGIEIPTLCYDPDIRLAGNCRLCLVEVEGRRGLIPACVSTCVDDMRVNTDSPAVIRARKLVLELLLARHPQRCDSCAKLGDCRFHDYLRRYDVDKSRFVEGGSHEFPVKDANPFIVRNYEHCIMCTKCVRACEDITGARAITVINRGSWSVPATAFNSSYTESSCVFCGQCVMVCPTATLTNRIAREVKPADRDEIKKVRTICPYCGVGCTIELNVLDNRVVGVTSFRYPHLSPANQGAMCVKGRYGWDFIDSKDRLKAPLMRSLGRLREVSWDKALEATVQRLGEIKDEYGPDSIAVLASARVTNEENYLIQKFARAVIGTNNVDHCARL